MYTANHVYVERPLRTGFWVGLGIALGSAVPAVLFALLYGGAVALLFFL